MSWILAGKVNEVTRAETLVYDERNIPTGKTRVYVTAEVTLTGPAIKSTTVTLYSYEDDALLTIGTSVKLIVEEG